MKLFVYGTLMAAPVMRSVSGHELDGEPAVLYGFRRRQLSGEVYPAIVPWPGDEVRGILYRGLAAAQLALLDVFEGEMYRREMVEVTCASGRRAAQAYVLSAAHRHTLSDHPWSFEDFLAKGLARFLGGYPGFSAVDDEGERFDRRR